MISKVNANEFSSKFNSKKEVRSKFDLDPPFFCSGLPILGRRMSCLPACVLNSLYLSPAGHNVREKGHDQMWWCQVHQHSLLWRSFNRWHHKLGQSVQRLWCYAIPSIAWKRAAPFILNINQKDNGASLTAP